MSQSASTEEENAIAHSPAMPPGVVDEFLEQDAITDARILIIDDEPANVLLLETVLEDSGYTNVQGTTNSNESLAVYLRFQPDIILLDLMMPGTDGYAVLEQLQPHIPPNVFLPIVVLTADTALKSKQRALQLGAADFLTKPFDAIELSIRLQNLLSHRFLHRQLQHQNEILEQKVQERTQRLVSLEWETADCLALAGEFRDDDTGHHTQRVGVTASLLAYHIGLPESTQQLLLQAAPLHDVGKIGISDTILLKPGKLTPEEFNTIKTHCRIGYSILSRHHTPLLQLAATIALSHHERWDGSGYPSGIMGEDIPLEGRIVAIADVFDALTHERPYKSASSTEEALAEMQAQAGRHFDPQLVQIFSTHLPEILNAHESYLAEISARRADTS